MARRSKALKPAALKSKRDERYYPEHGTVFYSDSRGARTLQRTFLFSDFEEMFASESTAAASRYAEMRSAAEQWIRDEREPGLDALGRKGEPDGKGSKRSTKRATRFAARQWSFEIGIRKGFLSPAAIAADFIAAAEHVHALAGGNSKLLNAVYQFADAWHWMHFEGSGEHELAAKGLRGPPGLKKGPETKRLNASIKNEIIRAELAENGGRAGRRAKGLAGRLLNSVNKRLEKRGMKVMTEAALERALRPLLKEADKTGQF